MSSSQFPYGMVPVRVMPSGYDMDMGIGHAVFKG